MSTTACRCGCPKDMHIGEIGCPCGLPDEPPCATLDAGDANGPLSEAEERLRGHLRQTTGGLGIADLDAFLAARVAAARAEERERIARRLEKQVAIIGATDPGDPVRAGLIEGYRDAARIARGDA